ncbi:hypothetical protein [uncultured Winogradskyella sp.]|uniref:hypothetical protein n=1 Tax=uncultured Winogradskyella sp. TaxID=395353 RepID=UPI002633C41B|nr:hypothetical protein [uncultured Winogradskyella sp.]|tara:strand:+ start:132 stop:890 length:759 start_codon:yes stop_codon:yes gene_type:complete
MLKTISTLLILFATLTSYSQNFTLIKNTHPQARELKHSLNKTKDSLVLECDHKIVNVDFFNEDFEKTVIVEDLKTKISLEDFPEGKFIIEAKLTDKIILIDLIKHEEYKSNDLTNINEPAEGQGMMLDETLTVIKNAPNKSISFMLTREKATQQNTTTNKFYWVISQTNNKIGSSKTMKLADQKSVDRMILKHKVELDSDCGKLNELTIWEVYNTREFMEKQVSNPDFVYTSTTDSFNRTPYYATKNKAQDL